MPRVPDPGDDEGKTIRLNQVWMPRAEPDLDEEDGDRPLHHLLPGALHQRRPERQALEETRMTRIPACLFPHGRMILRRRRRRPHGWTM